MMNVSINLTSYAILHVFKQGDAGDEGNIGESGLSGLHVSTH